MFSQKRFSLFSLFFIVFGLLIVTVTGLWSHGGIHDAKKPYLEFTSEPEITCSIDGWTFTHTKITDENGNVEQDWWWRVPEAPVFKIEATAHGYGWAHITFHGKYDVSKGQEKYGDPKNATSQQLGAWHGFLPVDLSSPDHDIVVRKYGTFTYDPKTYKWEGDGTIKLVPVYWQWGLAIVIPTGSWQNADKEFHRELDADADGSWVVNHNHKDRRKKPQIRPPEDDDDGGSSGSPNIALTPSDSSSMITAGSSYTMNLSVPSGYTSIHWYIKGPSDAGYGTTAATQTGSGSISTSASYTYSIPSDASGEYVLTAYIYLADNTIAEPSYTVSVSNSGTSTSSSTSPSESSTWLYCVKCEELYMPIYNAEGSCLEGGSHQDSY